MESVAVAQIDGVSEAESLAHYKAGHDMKGPCLVCGMAPTMGAWTDYNGQVYCLRCGCTYQIGGSHLSDEYLQKNGVTKADIAQTYCDMFEAVPVARAYFNETNRRARWGMWIGADCPIPASDRKVWGEWLRANVDRIRPNYPAMWDWDGILSSGT